MNVKDFVDLLSSEFYVGVPDSQLREFCDFLMDSIGISNRHIIAANEGNCVALAAGYYLATGKIPVVYMQNSGIGNIINPVVSLLNERVYNIPCIFVVGWRGEPGVGDEPQHIFQGEISKKLLEAIGLYTVVLDKSVEIDELKNVRDILTDGRSVAFLVRKNTLLYDNRVTYNNSHTMIREKVIESIVEAADQDVIISTTGKISRELYEVRDRKMQDHRYDFLTVGSMGHCSSIALGIALNKPKAKVWCIDGDGSVLMHMGSMAIIGNNCPSNMIHIVINNEAHETVGGMPTAASNIDLCKIAEGCGYIYTARVETQEDLNNKLILAKNSDSLSFIEIKCAIGSRADLGRPRKTTHENKKEFMEYLEKIH